MLTSVNNSSIIQSSKDKGDSYSINNISNYQSNQNNINNISRKKSEKRVDYKKVEIIIIIQFTKRILQKMKCIIRKKASITKQNIIQSKRKIKTKNYSLTSINSRKNSVDKDKEKDKDKDKEKGDIMKKLHKLNFNGLFKNKNYNNKLEYSSKNSSKNIINLNNKKNYIQMTFLILKKKENMSISFWNLTLKLHKVVIIEK